MHIKNLNEIKHNVLTRLLKEAASINGITARKLKDCFISAAKDKIIRSLKEKRNVAFYHDDIEKNNKVLVHIAKVVIIVDLYINAKIKKIDAKNQFVSMIKQIKLDKHKTYIILTDDKEIVLDHTKALTGNRDDTIFKQLDNKYEAEFEKKRRDADLKAREQEDVDDDDEEDEDEEDVNEDKTQVTVDSLLSQIRKKQKDVKDDVLKNIKKVVEKANYIQTLTGYAITFRNIIRNSGETDSEHKTGSAVDFNFDTRSPKKLFELYKKMLNDPKLKQGGIGFYVYEENNKKRCHIHYDIRQNSPRWIWYVDEWNKDLKLAPKRKQALLRDINKTTYKDFARNVKVYGIETFKAPPFEIHKAREWKEKNLVDHDDTLRADIGKKTYLVRITDDYLNVGVKHSADITKNIKKHVWKIETKQDMLFFKKTISLTFKKVIFKDYDNYEFTVAGPVSLGATTIKADKRFMIGLLNMITSKSKRFNVNKVIKGEKKTMTFVRVK